MSADYSRNELEALYNEYIGTKSRTNLLEELNCLLKQAELRNYIYEFMFDKDFSTVELSEQQISSLVKTLNSIKSIQEIDERRPVLSTENVYQKRIRVLEEKKKNENDEIVKKYLLSRICEIETEFELTKSKPLLDSIDRLISDIKAQYLKKHCDFGKEVTIEDYNNSSQFYKEIIEVISKKLMQQNNSYIVNYLKSQVNKYKNKIENLNRKIILKKVEDQIKEIDDLIVENFVENNNYTNIIGILNSKIKEEKDDLIIDYLKTKVASIETNPLLKIRCEIYENNCRISAIRKILVTSSYIVAVGSKVCILYLDGNDEDEFLICESYHGVKKGTLNYELKYVPTYGEISDKSPIGMALMDGKVGDIIAVNSPDRKINVQIKSISFLQ